MLVKNLCAQIFSISRRSATSQCSLIFKRNSMVEANSKNLIKVDGVESHQEFFESLARDWKRARKEGRKTSDQDVFIRFKKHGVFLKSHERKKKVEIKAKPVVPTEQLEVKSIALNCRGSRKTSKALVTIMPNVEYEKLKEVPGAMEALKKNKDLEGLFLESESSGENYFVNSCSMFDYFHHRYWVRKALQPLSTAIALDRVKVFATSSGGGVTGQVGAIKLGLARCLVKVEPTLKVALARNSFLSRDQRRVERKVPGRPKARKKFTWVKR